MKKLLVLIAAAASACTNQPAPAPPAQAAAEQARPGRMWNIERETCAQLLAVSDDDRMAVAMFYYGHVAARAGIRVIDGAQVEARIARAMAQCEANPALPIVQAFQRALVARRAPPAPRS